MAKRFFYVSMGILALMVAYNLGARSAEADWDSTLPGEIIGAAGLTVYTCNGEAWDVDQGWVRKPDMDLPVPSSEVKILTSSGSVVYLITQSEELYRTNGGWSYYGPFPGSGTPTTKSSWGDVKRKFR